MDDEDGFALSYPSITALQLGAEVVTDGASPQSLSAIQIRRRISRINGILGTGARQRTIIELDPDLPTVTANILRSGGRNAFFEFVRKLLGMLEISTLARRTPRAETNSAAKGTILEFLYELQSNALEHGRALRNARFLRLQKHLYPSRTQALVHAEGFAELKEYLELQPNRPPNRPFNLLEASVSDFGPGILDGFLASFAGEVHRKRPRSQVMLELLHEQLSSKSDPNAGLGTQNALAAAQEIGAFVSLRTGEFWLVLPGRLHQKPELVFRNGKFPHVPGTHWQLLLPDRRPGRERISRPRTATPPA